VKDNFCDDHIIAVSVHKSLQDTDWRPSEGTVKFAWNCGYKV